ncbi:MAG TPA: hypothetical protein VFM18_03245, partial [Methanosarcina sp.]|nr:hypothetical protein [Methanosarcina sp.]
MSVKPMLASDASDNLEMVKYPVMVSPKLDGIRCLKIDGKAVSRNGKPIPNTFVREYVEKHAQEGDDGELIIKGEFNKVASGIMSRSGEPDFEFQIFDNFRIDDTYKNRFQNLKVGGRIALVPHVIVKNEKELMTMEERWVDEGYEGIMLNDPMGLYKHGRSTLRGRELAKIKRFKDEEAIIVGFEEQMKNTNEAKK